MSHFLFTARGLAVIGALVASMPACAQGEPSVAQVPSSIADRTGDGCDFVVWRPRRQYADRASCRPSLTPGEIADRARLVALGSLWDAPGPDQLPAPDRCMGQLGHAANARYAAEIRAQATPGAAPPIIHLHRFDLVPVTLAARPGFDSRFLVTTDRPFARVLGFFRPGQWSDSFRGDAALDPGPRLRDWIDGSGGPGTFRRIVYYLNSPARADAPVWPQAALGNLSNPDYRAWRVAEAELAMEQGTYDAVMLNQKFYQFDPRRGSYWIGSDTVPTATVFRRRGETAWSAPPRDYDLSRYQAGWAALGRDLSAAGVPYAVLLSQNAMTHGNAHIRTTTEDARYVIWQKAGPGTPALRRRLLALRAAGVTTIARCRAAAGNE